MQCLINLLDQDTVEALCDSFPKINSADIYQNVSFMVLHW